MKGVEALIKVKINFSNFNSRICSHQKRKWEQTKNTTPR